MSIFLIRNEGVGGSSPFRGTNKPFGLHAFFSFHKARLSSNRLARQYACSAARASSALSPGSAKRSRHQNTNLESGVRISPGAPPSRTQSADRRKVGIDVSSHRGMYSARVGKPANVLSGTWKFVANNAGEFAANHALSEIDS